MKRLATLTMALWLTTHPAGAQTAPEQEGTDLMGEALRLFMQGLLQEMEPAIEGMENFFRDLDAYHPPEVLPNGDIIIRRKSPLEAAPEGEIEL